MLTNDSNTANRASCSCKKNNLENTIAGTKSNIENVTSLVNEIEEKSTTVNGIRKEKTAADGLDNIASSIKNGQAKR